MNAPLPTDQVNDWLPNTDFERIAVAIGHHFWKCKTDRDACNAGRDAAMDVQRALRNAT